MKQRDIELLSSYLDGQLSSVDTARLEARLRTDPEMRSVLQDLRGARSLLRQLPMRKAPRNFTLTPKMVGKNPPLPRSYPVFKFTAALATIMLFFTYAFNILGPQLAAQPVAFGMGGGGAPNAYESTLATEAPAIAAAPAATEPPAAATEAAVGQEPSVAMAPYSTATAAAAEEANSTRVMGTVVAKQSDTEAANAASSGLAQGPPQMTAQPAPVNAVSPLWQWFLAGIALISLFIMALMKQRSVSRWRSRT
jgi:anti-sigma factor RsiW